MTNVHPLTLAEDILENGQGDRPTNRITEELSELADGVSLIESFSHVVTLDTQDWLVCFYTSGRRSGKAVVSALRGWSSKPVHSIVYTHGHVDHVGGSSVFAADAADRGHPAPRVLGHRALNPRLDRYDYTNGYNLAINMRQFGGAPKGEGMQGSFVPDGTLRVDTDYESVMIDQVGGVTFEHNHAMGETDDHTWTWVPEYRMITAGDLFCWMFPNCGNPQKVQRYPLEWAQALRAMAAKEPDLIVPAHGLPIAGRDRIVSNLDVVASALEQLVADVVDAMNTGATLDDILHTVRVDPAYADSVFLRPQYDEPEFVIHNIWRLYGGWWDGHPARLKPAPDAAIAAEVAGLAGGHQPLVDRAVALAAAGEFRLACELIEWAVRVAPDDREVHEARIEIYQQRRRIETSLMAKGVFQTEVSNSKLALGQQAEARFRINIVTDD